MIEHRGFTKVLFGATMLLEMFAFTALMGRKHSLFIGAALIVFHLSVLHLMFINFYLNVIVLLLFYVNVPHWILRWIDRSKATSPPHQVGSTAA